MNTTPQRPYPRTFSHIGISVPDLEAAVKFYTEVLGWYLIMKPTEITEDDSAIGEMCTDVFGAGWEHFRIAHLSTGDRIGVELFEFKNQEKSHYSTDTWDIEYNFPIGWRELQGIADRGTYDLTAHQEKSNSLVVPMQRR